MNAFTPVPGAQDSASLGADADHAMTRAIESLALTESRSTAEMLLQLRREFPGSPLSVRVRALEVLRKR